MFVLHYSPIIFFKSTKHCLLSLHDPLKDLLGKYEILLLRSSSVQFLVLFFFCGNIGANSFFEDFLEIVKSPSTISIFSASCLILYSSNSFSSNGTRFLIINLIFLSPPSSIKSRASVPGAVSAFRWWILLSKYLSARIILLFGFEAHITKTSLENPLSRSPLLANTTLILRIPQYCNKHLLKILKNMHQGQILYYATIGPTYALILKHVQLISIERTH
ncbi:hypothetical protein AGLY_002374 [Aphis glycines]|uniref:Uncharacterized protein n=1 Tax=Aphis glycines TaxID=307491 RepID=A0A6G0U3C0_APHGL|nr:hypothetical protein AGLY_002374 [Aphis glycines]